MDRSRNIIHGKWLWRYEKADLEQGAYTVLDPGRDKMAAILPHDRAKPIEHGQNARLLTREHRLDDWEDRGAYDLRTAMTKGNEHCGRYMKAFNDYLDKYAPDADPIP
jgi:hypothetical protein